MSTRFVAVVVAVAVSTTASPHGRHQPKSLPFV